MAKLRVSYHFDQGPRPYAVITVEEGDQRYFSYDPEDPEGIWVSYDPTKVVAPSDLQRVRRVCPSADTLEELEEIVERRFLAPARQE